MKRCYVTYATVFSADDEEHAAEQFLDEIGIDVAILPREVIKEVARNLVIEMEEGD